MKNYRDVVRDFVGDTEEASEYLRVSLEEYEKDGDVDAFLTAIRTVAEAQFCVPSD
mgnify:CR=1 FL=1